MAQAGPSVTRKAGPAPGSPPATLFGLGQGTTRSQIALAVSVLAFLGIFLVWPVATVVAAAFRVESTGPFTLVNFADFASSELFRRSLWHSLLVSAATVALASLFALPLAIITARFRFPGTLLVHTLGIVPLIMPPFVGAVAMQLLLGRNGTVNLWLKQATGFTIPFMEGLNGVVLLEAIHYFPFILVNLTAALANIDRSMEEAAQNLGSSGVRLFRRIVLPLAMPGYVAGALLVFVKVFDDIATPLLLGVKDMLAPQAYLRVTSIGVSDPMGYVIAVVLIVISLAALWLSSLATRGRDYATVQRGGGGPARRALTKGESFAAWAIVVLVLGIVLMPHVGLLLLSFATVWSFSPLPDGYTLAHYARVLDESSGYIGNTLLYAGLAALLDVVLGVVIAYLVLRTRLAWRHWLDYAAMSAIAVPGVVLGIGYLRAFYGITLPGGTPLATLWIMIVLALAIRRIPYALRAAVAALQQISVALEEAAENLGATKARTFRRILVPLMTGGIVAGFVTSFANAAVELSATLMLVQSDADAPLAFGIYVFMQSPAGRGAGAALGVIAVVIAAAATFASHRLAGGDPSHRH